MTHYPRIASLGTPARLRERLAELDLDLPVDDEVAPARDSPLSKRFDLGEGRSVGNRFVVQPMEGWDGTADGRPGELTRRRWRNFGRSGAAWIWGGEAVAVRADGRANPNQLLLTDATAGAIAALRRELIQAAREARFPTPLVGLQLTHSGRWSRPEPGRAAPRIAFRHPLLDARAGVRDDIVTLSDAEVDDLVACFAHAARLAREAGFDFVDLKHCHGYLLHEFLAARSRSGRFGGPTLSQRTRLLRTLIAAMRAAAPDLPIAVRLSVFDGVPHRAAGVDEAGHLGVGAPESHALPYEFGFGLDPDAPERVKLDEANAMVAELCALGVTWINVTAGSPYYVPHLQRPAAFPPSDGYAPPEDPLCGVARLLDAARQVKRAVPQAIVVSSGWTYLQEYIPHVAQACLHRGWFDAVGLGRMMLAYPELPADLLAGRQPDRRRLCRTFSDCTTAPRQGLVSGCYPLDPFYGGLPERARLEAAKRAAKEPRSIALEAAFAWRRSRAPHGISAVLLPYTSDGRIDWAAFERHLLRTARAGLDAAVNMDTGFGDLLTPPERDSVLDATRRILGAGVPFYAGAFADESGSYRRALAAIEKRGATPVIVQCRVMHMLGAAEKASFYRRLVGDCARAVAFELGPVFAPHGEIWSDEAFARILEIDKIVGAKHSSLDRAIELRRLEACDRLRPEFRVYTGNDLAIDMVAYGSDYLLGLSTFAPESFAARDRALAGGDLAYLQLNDALQHLGNIAFRAPVPAYKHAAAQYLHITGGLDSDSIHPRAARRPGSDRILLLDCAVRLGTVADPEQAFATRVAPYLDT